jgi:hypothetical protein
MKHIYLLAFTGGAGGDFLCSQVSKDPDFYPLETRVNQTLNVYNLDNSFEKWDLDIKNRNIVRMKISETVLEEIDLYYNEKNLITPTHFFGDFNRINFPRIKGIKLYSKILTPFFYLLLWIKRWVNLRYFKTKTETARVLESLNPNSTIEFREEMIDRVLKTRNRNHFYAFELAALKTLCMDAIDLVDNYYVNSYRRISELPNSDFGWIPYNIDNLYLDPINNTREFSQIFNMEQPIDPDIIAEYYSLNHQLIEKTFNETYESFISSDWTSKLKEWVQNQCPDSYIVDFKIE